MDMKKRLWFRNGLLLVGAVIAFALSMFAFAHPVWIAAWIAPMLLMRFIRGNKWIVSLIAGFLVLQTANMIGMVPFFALVDSVSMKMQTSSFLAMQVKSGMLFLALMYLVPFLIDKALRDRLPKSAATLVYPAAVTAVDVFGMWMFGLTSSFADAQFQLPPLVMTASLAGASGLTFLIAWTASMANALWEEEWNLRRIGRAGWAYLAVTAGMLGYGAVAAVVPAKVARKVPVAGITLDYNFFEDMGATGLYLEEILALDPAEYAGWMSSTPEQMEEMRRKTLQAAESGAKIIVWQEYALTLSSAVADPYLEDIRRLADEQDAYVLVSYSRILDGEEKAEKLERNLGVLFTPEGEVGWEYAKALLGVGYEDLVVEAGPFDIPYVDTPFGRMGQVICSDMTRPAYLRQAAEKEIELLLVPSYDAPMFVPLFTFNSAYRAVENGFTMVRVAGLTGYSAAIDPDYRIWAGQDFTAREPSIFYVNVPVVSRRTVYSGIGYLFPYLASLLLVALMAVAVAGTLGRGGKKE
jgi:apolipoprotein N-acyltransferase